MAGAPYVSVIIPTYNRAKMLPITLDSFVRQDYPQDR
ncbi:MAG TPA: glycosyltransferase family A protein, partial [Terriglobia bacterium]|nr:glycosyltransferase family A protein [Terriglobia bacterium]